MTSRRMLYETQRPRRESSKFSRNALLYETLWPRRERSSNAILYETQGPSRESRRFVYKCSKVRIPYEPYFNVLGTKEERK